jgi:hypothetical protein
MQKVYILSEHVIVRHQVSYGKEKSQSGTRQQDNRELGRSEEFG